MKTNRKQAKSRVSKQAVEANGNPEHIEIVLMDADTLRHVAAQRKAHAWLNSINSLIPIYNALVDTLSSMSYSNRQTIERTLALLDTELDQKLERYNEWLDGELEAAYAKLPKRTYKRRKAVKAKPRKYRKSKNGRRKAAKKAKGAKPGKPSRKAPKSVAKNGRRTRKS